MSELSQQFFGRWQGSSRLFLNWMETAEYDSDSQMQVASVMDRRFIEFRYHWRHEDKDQQGVILVGDELQPGQLCATWADSWHMGKNIMSCQGQQAGGKDIVLRGSYTVENAPDWYWRIELHLRKPDELEMCMYNISPEGKEDLAVCASYQRRPN